MTDRPEDTGAPISLRSGLQVMIVGSASAGAGFAIGHLVTALFQRELSPSERPPGR